MRTTSSFSFAAGNETRRCLAETVMLESLPLSKVPRSRGKVESLHQDPKFAGFQGSKICSRLRFQGSKVPGFQGLSLQVFFKGFMVPGLKDA